MSAKTLTKRQKQVLDYINGFRGKNGISPSLEEIKKHLKLSSVSTAHFHVNKLRKFGFLTKKDHYPRSIMFKNLIPTIEIPLVGKIVAGEPLEAIKISGNMVSVPKDKLDNSFRHYALAIQDAGVKKNKTGNGNVVIVKERKMYGYKDSFASGVNEASLINEEKIVSGLECLSQDLFPLLKKEEELKIVVEKYENIELGKNNLSQEFASNVFLSNKYKLNCIYNMDCLNLMKYIRNESVDLIFADPPYNLSKSNFNMKFTKSGGADLNTNKGSWDHYSQEEFENFTKTWLYECYRILKKTGSIWVAGTYHNIYTVGYLMKKIGFDVLNEILWHKSDATPNLSCTRFVADHENFIWARKSKGNTFNYALMKNLNGGKQMRSIWTRGKTAGGKKIHPTQKPEWLLERVILSTSKEDDVVFDPFVGSGTTAAMAKKLNRVYLGSEIDVEYYKNAVKRINEI